MMSLSRETIGRRWEASDRGLRYYTPVELDRGSLVSVYESSAAASPHLWLNLDGQTAHMTVEQAEALCTTLGLAIEQHYQTREHDPTAWKAGDPCAMCGSSDTGEDTVRGGFCNTCGAADSDE
jgi:hypothetical protein